MTSKERLLTALSGKKPDRLPITLHQWQRYHLATYMNGMDQVEAFKATGLDAAVTFWDNVFVMDGGEWRHGREDLGMVEGHREVRHRVQTPGGELTWRTGSTEVTTFNLEHMIKTQQDAEIFLKYWPRRGLDKEKVAKQYEEVGDAGIVRGFVATEAQPGPWQEFCELVGTEKAVLWAMDEPEFVHHFLDTLTKRKEEYVHEQMAGAKYDLIEHGGGAASSTVISPSMFEEFCVPYDRRIITALHAVGHKVVYHTCGGMMAILDRIPLNGCDASETLSPPGVGGDIRTHDDREKVKQVLGKKVALIGGIDQGRLEKLCPAEEIAAEVRECFNTYGRDGGYICSASDHFFFAPVENLKALAAAARECRY